MPTDWVQASLPGVMRRSSVITEDRRGSFSELWRASGTGGLSGSRFVQANLSRSASGVLRGMHFHRRQADLWILIEGTAFVALTDLREPPDGRQPPIDSFRMDAGDVVFIPEMVAHGFYAVEPIALVYLVTNEYDGSDELGFAWDDPDARIHWPAADPIVSDRDRANPSLRDAFSRLVG